jgi:hypothetical protein
MGTGAGPRSPSGDPRFFWEEDMEQPSPVDLAWAAGFFDGDGHVGLVSGVQVEMTQKFKLPLVRFQEILGPSTFYRVSPSGRRPSHLWELAYYGERGVRVLRSLLPYLVAKRVEAELAIQCYEVCFLPHRKGSPRSPVERAELASYQEALVEHRHRPVEDE